MQDVTAIIIAGSSSPRMNPERPNFTAEVLFRPMINWVGDTLDEACIGERCALACDGARELEEIFGGSVITVAPGEEQPVCAALGWLREHSAKHCLVLYAEAPFVDSAAILGSFEQHKNQNNLLTILASGDRSTLIREMNASAFWFEADFIMDFFARAEPEKRNSPAIVSELVRWADSVGGHTGSFVAGRRELNLRCGTCSELLHFNDLARARSIQRLCEAGVEVLCSDGVMIAPEVKVGAGTKILPGTILKGRTVIGRDCIIGPGSLIDESKIGDGCTVNATQIHRSCLCDRVSIGPFSQVRPDCIIHEGVKIGDFVEVKNSDIGARTAVAHLTYVGDSDVGEGVNFGCGVVTVNYDGKYKHRTVIGNNAFIGCNTNLVAPVRVGNRAYTAAGTTVTEDVPDDSLAIGRARQSVKVNWVKEHDKIKIK